MGLIWRYVQAKIQSRVGINANVIIASTLALVFACLMLVFALVALFESLAEHYGSVMASLIIGGAFLLLAVTSAVFAFMSHRKAIQIAKKKLSIVAGGALLHPQYRPALFAIAKHAGPHRVVPVVGVGLLMGGLVQELRRRKKPPSSV